MATALIIGVAVHATSALIITVLYARAAHTDPGPEARTASLPPTRKAPRS